MTQSARFDDARQQRFTTTQWTLVVAARGDSAEARKALGMLCTAYYRPVEAFIQKSCRSPQDAHDLTQDFFARVLDGKGFERAEPSRGRFRSYMLGCVKHFLSDANDQRMAAKRGAGKKPLSIHAPGSADRESCDMPLIDSAGFPPDAFFDRHWAVELLERVLAALSLQHEQAGKLEEFERLKPCLTGDAAMPTSAELAKQLNLSPEAAAMAVHRLRKRFRAAVKAEISETVGSEEEVRSELDYLIQALSLAGEADSTPELE
ncbi:RNA polymerase sigma factor [Novipirellula artificiosorum]|uniref:Sigma-70 region 2 n=1 Tax=Novipirellula artificiosorum TaxID=2528016 RepID=A0A5C6DUK7_9BACT|nr:sigma-70 family RNA polymerase sigma factor [Novipirellula artificiosorum]TWU39597.1 Sigma-70 region 2 [Novipirellula artificiosorum]